MLNDAKVQGSNIATDLSVGIQVTKETLENQSNLANISYVINGQVITQSFMDFYNVFGLLYTYDQAREACPEGWSIPTQANWNDLDAILREQTGSGNTSGLKYPALNFGVANSSKYPNPTLWNNIGDVCEEIDESINISFNAMPSGAIYSSGGAKVWQFSNGAYYWMYSTTDLADRAALRAHQDFIDYSGGPYGLHIGYALRCVRNTSPSK